MKASVEKYCHWHLYSSIILSDSNFGSNPKITTAVKFCIKILLQMQLFAKKGLVTESMIAVINDFFLLLKRNFINVVRATIINNTFQLHFTWIIKPQGSIFHCRDEVSFFWITQISILQGIFLVFLKCCLTGYFSKETYILVKTWLEN